MFKKKYTGLGYPSVEAICKEALHNGFTHYFWATESPRFADLYNGDTVVIYDGTTEDMPAPLKADAEKYGKPIKPIW
jgi:nitrogen fixation-related uncharacterized protein